MTWIELNSKLGYANARLAALIFPLIGHYLVILDTEAWSYIGSNHGSEKDVNPIFSYHTYLLYFSALSISIAYYICEFLMPKIFVGITKKSDFLNTENTDKNNLIIKGGLSEYTLENMSWSDQLHQYWNNKKEAKITGHIIDKLILFSKILAIIYIMVGIYRVVLTLF